MQKISDQQSPAGTSSASVAPEVNQALASLCRAVLPVWGRQLATSRAQSEAAVLEMIAAFAAMSPHLDMAVRETPMLGQQVERMYTGFQYQDRISQMMTLLHDDMLRLQALMQTPVADVDALAPEAWLARLESQYAMAEQRQGHAPEAASGDDLLPDTGIETTFF